MGERGGGGGCRESTGTAGSGDTVGCRLWEIRVKGWGLSGLCMLKEGFGVVSS